MRFFRLLFALALSLPMLAACATPPPASQPEALADYRETNDPLEPTNRVIYEVSNDIADITLTPAARAYRWALPEGVRNSVSNVLSNLGSPVRFGNDVLQFKSRRAGDTLMRFVINSTLGLGGIFDIASGWGYPSHPSDFGMTLAVWGTPPGPYLFLPLLGPTDPRDVVGFAADTAANPVRGMGSGPGITVFNWLTLGTTTISEYADNLPAINEVKRTALDPYATFRSLYRQHRAAQIAAAKKDRPATIPVWFSLPTKQQSE
ncbi:MAG TPA: VacJ family lipoprotein [Acetobacteraceae bacterium]|jgi:phospholipid-binding lipoprotein MlaA|nr:VacJ family lipoprotein [Acetobacteraceae bacterium]